MITNKQKKEIDELLEKIEKEDKELKEKIEKFFNSLNNGVVSKSIEKLKEILSE